MLDSPSQDLLSMVYDVIDHIDGVLAADGKVRARAARPPG
jgi:hypothetical protein